MYLRKKSIYRAGMLAAALIAQQGFAATNFVQTNLVADVSGVAAVTDPNLVGTWGISESAGSPFWVSNTSNGTSTLYTVTTATAAMPVVSTTVAIVPAASSGKMRSYWRHSSPSERFQSMLAWMP